jgi:translation elongation factor EF-Ts
MMELAEKFETVFMHDKNISGTLKKYIQKISENHELFRKQINTLMTDLLNISHKGHLVYLPEN